MWLGGLNKVVGGLRGRMVVGILDENLHGRTAGEFDRCWEERKGEFGR